MEKEALAAERRNQFVTGALVTRDALLETGQGYDADEVHAYLKDRAAGKSTPRPETKPWQG